jgi:hypothetical protein
LSSSIEEVSTIEAAPAPVSSVLFAVYGFQVEVPENWRVEMNPKGSQKKGDVAFHSLKGNRFFISWGLLEDATKRFKSLDEQRDTSIKQVKRGPDVTKIDVGSQREEEVSGHRTLVTHVTATVKGGFLSRAVAEKDMWSAHLYCPEQGRFYVIYCLLRDKDEYGDIAPVFDKMIKSFSCHRTIAPGFR